MSSSPASPPPVAPQLPAHVAWTPLGAPRDELRLELTLVTGQSFRWRHLGDGVYVGVVGARCFLLRQTDSDVLFACPLDGAGAAPAAAAAALREYLTLDVSLAALHERFAAADARFAALAPHVRGARMLRQDPLECLMSFICSSNNHISRIHGMTLHAFPTLDQLGAAKEEELRGLGFGYRAKFITGTVAALAAKPAGGAAWLGALRAAPREEAVAALSELPGIGPKVAACVSLFALDKHDCIPVDTHVWQLAVQHYTPHLADKSLTPRVMGEVQAAIQGVFGPYAGWAHNALFIAELAHIRAALPAALQTPPRAKGAGKGARKRAAGDEAAEGGAAGEKPAAKAARGGKGGAKQPKPKKAAAAVAAAIVGAGETAEAAQQ